MEVSCKNHRKHALESVMPGPLMSGLAAGEDRKDWVGPAPAAASPCGCPSSSGGRQDYAASSAGLGRGVGVAHLLGRHEAGRRGHVGKIRLVEPEGPQWEAWWCHLLPA